MQVIESILADAAQIAALRRDIHAHPELCFEEKRTSDLIAEQLTDWGIPIHRGLGTTGVVAHPEERHAASAPSACAPTWTRCRSPSTTPSRTRSTQRRQDARVRPRRPHRDAARRRQAPVEAPQLRRHGLPDLPAGRRRRRRRARDDQGRPVREVPDGGRVRRAQLAGPEGGPVRAQDRAGVRVEQRVQDRRSAARARTRRCRTTASTRCRWPARWCRRFQTIITPQQAADRRRRDLGDDDPRRRGDQRRARQLRDRRARCAPSRSRCST